jgi:hypothetical protein
MVQNPPFVLRISACHACSLSRLMEVHPVWWQHAASSEIFFSELYFCYSLASGFSRYGVLCPTINPIRYFTWMLRVLPTVSINRIRLKMTIWNDIYLVPAVHAAGPSERHGETDPTEYIWTQSYSVPAVYTSPSNSPIWLRPATPTFL